MVIKYQRSAEQTKRKATTKYRCYWRNFIERQSAFNFDPPWEGALTLRRVRRFVATTDSRYLDVRLTLAALEAAVVKGQPSPGLIHHSDRGSQYASKQYRDRLEALGICGSMGRTGNPYDNAKAESFFKTLKHEEVYAYEKGDGKEDARAQP